MSDERTLGGITATILLSLPFEMTLECLHIYLHTLPALIVACDALAGCDRGRMLPFAQRGFAIGFWEPQIRC